MKRETVGIHDGLRISLDDVAGYSKTVKQKCAEGEDKLIHALFYMQYERSKLDPSFTEKVTQHGEPMNWYYHSGEKVFGPYPASAMRSWYAQKKLKPDLLVRKGSSGMFVMLKSITSGQGEDVNPFVETPRQKRNEIMKDAYSSLIGVVAAMRVTQ